MSSRPSPSTSPRVTPSQSPADPLKPHSFVTSRNRPESLRKTRIGAHSHASTRSSSPSPSRSPHTAPFTTPASRKTAQPASSGIHRPCSRRKICDGAASGYRPGIAAPPTNSSNIPSPSRSPRASGPGTIPNPVKGWAPGIPPLRGVSSTTGLAPPETSFIARPTNACGVPSPPAERRVTRPETSPLWKNGIGSAGAMAKPPRVSLV